MSVKSSARRQRSLVVRAESRRIQKRKQGAEVAEARGTAGAVAGALGTVVRDDAMYDEWQRTAPAHAVDGTGQEAEFAQMVNNRLRKYRLSAGNGKSGKRTGSLGIRDCS
jgi:hypothetical protein